MTENIGATQVADAPSEETTEQAAIKADDASRLAKRYKVKIDGAESEVDEDELVRSYQLRKVSDKRLQEATQSRKQAEEFVNLLKNDPIKLLSDPRIGHDVKKLAEEYLMKELENEMLSPEQRELKETKSKLKSYEDWKQEQEKAAITAQEQQVVSHYTQKYQQDIISALDKSGLPRSESTVNRMINYMSQSLENGYGLEADDVVDLVKMDYIKDTKSLYQGVPDDVLLSILGDDIVKKVIKADLSRVRKNPAASAQRQQYSGQSAPTEKAQKISLDEWKAKMDKIKNGEE
jgi:hypothetical protein